MVTSARSQNVIFRVRAEVGAEGTRRSDLVHKLRDLGLQFTISHPSISTEKIEAIVKILEG